MIINGYKVPENFERQLEASLNARKCAFDPKAHIEPYTNQDGTVSFVLPLAAKRLWFFTWCAENQKEGSIFPSEPTIKGIGTDANNCQVAFAMAKAEVSIDGKCVSSGYAGQLVRMLDFADMGNVVQAVTGLAQSKALTNAGFGVIDRADAILPSPNGMQPPATNGTVNGSGELPFTFGTQAAPGPQSSPNPATAPNNGQAQVFQNLGGSIDPLTQAKRTPYPLKGYYEGRTLGELNTSALEKFVNQSYNNPIVESAQAAARLILEERKTMSGVPNTTGRNH